MAQVPVMPGAETPDHHGDHRALLREAADSSPQAKVDAIIVPTARSVSYLKEAAVAAKALGCPLVTLHSRKWTSAHAASYYLGQAIDLIAIDMPPVGDLRLPDLETSGLLTRTIFERRTDTSAKRNLSLVFSHMVGWERVVFLDDDIWVPFPSDLSRAAGLLGAHTAVGLKNTGFPDNSVVCHAFRRVGGKQGTFIGGGALAVDVKRNSSFFPNVYNEDWFYVLEAGKRLQSVATVGQVVQKAYDPYRTTERARTEEFGDVLAEGTFWLLDQGKTAMDGDLAHWRGFLAKRRRFIRHVLGMVERANSIEQAEQARMVEALKASLGRLACITPELCVAYLQALVADQERWQEHIEGVRPQPREMALNSLVRKDAAPLTWCINDRCSVPAPQPGPGRPRARSAPRLRPLRPGDLRPPAPPTTGSLPARLPVPESA